MKYSIFNAFLIRSRPSQNEHSPKHFPYLKNESIYIGSHILVLQKSFHATTYQVDNFFLTSSLFTTYHYHYFQFNEYTQYTSFKLTNG